VSKKSVQLSLPGIFPDISLSGTCEIERCDSTQYKNGLCHRHYSNWHNRGNAFKSRLWFPIKPNYSKPLKLEVVSRNIESYLNAKLTYDKVKEIRAFYLQGTYNQNKLAKMFNVSHQNIFLITHNKSWTDENYNPHSRQRIIKVVKIKPPKEIKLHKYRLANGKIGSRPEYQAWRNMIQRCYNPNIPSFEYYGSRGISVCDRWRTSFKNFFEDMGPKPDPKLTIERIDNDGNYEPGNCIWATYKEQNANKRKAVSRRPVFRGHDIFQ
jgi:hypothetical protein